jgi:hypothetical protein
VPVVGIDPGPVESAACLIGPSYEILCAVKLPNDQLRIWLSDLSYLHMVIEGMRGMGAKVGHETFEACYQVGRFWQMGESRLAKVTIYHRPEYLHPLCGGRPPKNKSDATLYTALKTRFGADHLKPLVGASDLRSAFGVAVYHLDKLKTGRK